jgi:hypothetical protein
MMNWTCKGFIEIKVYVGGDMLENIFSTLKGNILK